MKRSTLIPILLLIYLAVMAYIGRQELADGHYLFYFGVIGLTLACIIGLHFTLRHRERNRRKSFSKYPTASIHPATGLTDPRTSRYR